MFGILGDFDGSGLEIAINRQQKSYPYTFQYHSLQLVYASICSGLFGNKSLKKAEDFRSHSSHHPNEKHRG